VPYPEYGEEHQHVKILFSIFCQSRYISIDMSLAVTFIANFSVALLTRERNAGGVQVLQCLVPWAEHVVLDKREGARTSELLALLYQVTYRCA
jgi:hypothetical protein